METIILPPAGDKSSQPFRPQWQQLLTLALVALVALYFLWRVRDILPPFFIAFFFAALLDPVVTRLQRRGRSRGQAVLTIYLLVFLFILLTILLIGQRALNQVETIITNSARYENIGKLADDLYVRYQQPLKNVGITSNPFRDKTEPLAKAGLAALESVKSTIIGLAGKAIWIIIIPLALFYFLMDFQRLRAKLISFAPDRHQGSMDRMSQEVVDIFTAYFRSLTLVCILYGISAGIIMLILGVNYALFLGIAAGVLYAVPYVGPAVSVASIATISLTMDSPALFNLWKISPAAFSVTVVLVFLAMHVTFDYGITPRIIGGSVGLHPIANIFALMCGATLFGVWGMLLAVPVAASIQIVLIYFFPKLSQPLPQLSLPPATGADGGASE